MDNNRLLLELDRALKQINRETISPTLPKLNVSDLNPVISLTARARASYLEALFTLANNTKDGLPDAEKINSLRLQRITYEELMLGAQALETAIERGYLTVQG